MSNMRSSLLSLSVLILLCSLTLLRAEATQIHYIQNALEVGSVPEDPIKLYQP